MKEFLQMNKITELLEVVNRFAENLRPDNEEHYLNLLKELRYIIEGYNILAENPLKLEGVKIVKDNKNTIFAPFYTYKLVS